MITRRLRYSQRSTIPSLSGTFGIPARLALSPKMPKEPSSPSRSNARDVRQLHDKENQGQRTTMYKRNAGEVLKFSNLAIKRRRSKLIVKCL